MPIIVQQSQDQVTISLGEKFDFDSVDNFRNAYTQNTGKTFIVDFRNTEYMDSSGLGMLLNMRRHLGENNANIKLINCRNQIKKVLLISKFETKFAIS
jgi:anti-anti-sigma factor